MPLTNSNNPRLLLARLRKGDYAHAGEVEAIDLVMNLVKVYVNKNQPDENTITVRKKAFLDPERAHNLTDLVGKKMHPARPNKLMEMLTESGWELIEFHDCSLSYLNWYKSFLLNLEKQEHDLKLEFSMAAFETVKNVFSDLVAKMEQKIIGGGTFLARRRY